MDDAPDVMFSSNGAGGWWRRDWKKQCQEESMLTKRCQGAVGHRGQHWAYSPCGSYYWRHNTLDGPVPKMAAAGMTPPGHQKYVSPIDKADEYYLGMFVDSEVVDPAEIARISAGDLGENEMATEPCTEEEMKWLKDNGRLDWMD